MDLAHQAPLSMEIFRQQYWSGSPFPSPGDLPDPGIKPGSAALQEIFCTVGRFFTNRGTREASQSPCVCAVLGRSVVSDSLWPMDCSPPGSSVHGDSPGKNTGVGCHALLRGIFPTQGSNPGLPRCRRILYQLSPQGSPRILEWVAYLFSRGSSQPKNRTGVSWNAGGFFNSWATRVVQSLLTLSKLCYQSWLQSSLHPEKAVCISSNMLILPYIYTVLS